MCHYEFFFLLIHKEHRLYYKKTFIIVNCYVYNVNATKLCIGIEAKV